MDVHCFISVCNFSRGLEMRNPHSEEIKFYCMPKTLIIRLCIRCFAKKVLKAMSITWTLRYLEIRIDKVGLPRL